MHESFRNHYPLNNVRHIIHQRLYTKLIQQNRKIKKCKERTQPKTKITNGGLLYINHCLT